MSRLSTKKGALIRWIVLSAFDAVLVTSSLESQGVAQTWTQTSAPTNSWRAVACSADGAKVVAVAANGPIFLSTNSGASWRPINSPTSNYLAVCASADGNTLAAVASGATYVSRNAGLTWAATGPGLPSIACSADATKILTVGGTGQLFASADSGGNWTNLSFQAVPVGFGFLSIASSADGTKSLIASYDQGNIWVESDSNLWAGSGLWISGGVLGQGYAASLASSADGNKLAAWVNGFDLSGGTIYISTNGAANWNARVTSSAEFASIASSADGERLIAVGTGDTTYLSTNSGADWIPVKAPATNWVSVASSADGDKVLAAVSGGGIYAMQTEPMPSLQVISSPGGTMISWIIPSQSLVLEQSSDLAKPLWTDVPITPKLNLTNLRNEVTVAASQGMMFYRLATHPAPRLIAASSSSASPSVPENQKVPDHSAQIHE